MAAIYHNGDWYGLGSDVVANPQDSATDTLTKVGIDGTVYEVTDADAVHTSDIGTANGVAELDANGLVPSSQLPSYVDDVLEYASVSAFPATGETGKIYVALDTNLTYRWSGSAYVEISPSLALGETSSTAYRGDRGKTAYDHATESGRSGAKSAGLYKIGVTAQGHVASANAVAKADLTALGVADQNDVDAIEDDIEGYKTATGEYITITDGAELPAKNYSITIAPVQEGSGDPSPSNVRPIHGADEVGVRVIGFNQWDEEWESGMISDSNGQNSDNANYRRSKNYIPILTGKEYYTTIPSNKYGTVKFYFYRNDKSYISSAQQATGSITLPSGTCFIRFRANTTLDYGHDICINISKTTGSPKNGDYVPYNGNSTTITLPSTVYGGSVEMGGSGTETIGYAEFDGSSDEAWTLQSINSYGIANFFITVPNMSVQATDFAITNYLKRQTSLISQTTDMGFLLSPATQPTNGVLYVRLDQSLASTAAELKTWLASNTLQLCYTEITPTSLSVTPFPQTLLEGVNNVWAEMKENSVVIDNAQQSLSYQPQNIVGELRQEINAKPDSFAQLSDTSFSNLANGQIPKWNSTSQKWENANESGGGGASSLAELSDTNISSPADGQILKWDETASKWVNANEYSYTLPAADANTLGGIKVGDNLDMNGEVLSAKTVPWTQLAVLGYNETVAVPSSFSELMVITKHGARSCYSAIFPAAVADFSIYDMGPSLYIPVYYSGSMTIDSIACVVENVSDRYYAYVTGDESATATLYYR